MKIKVQKDNKTIDYGKFLNWLLKQNTLGSPLAYNPPMSSDEALNILANYLLGNNWRGMYIGSNEQINTAEGCEILTKYSRKFRKERRLYDKINKL